LDPAKLDTGDKAVVITLANKDSAARALNIPSQPKLASNA